MRFNNLNDWLSWQESLNPAEIELGLERVSVVLKQLGHSPSFNCPLITVAGTNGKGSVVAMLEAIVIAAGLKVCSYTSPHLLLYNERIRINGQSIDDDRLCEAFERIDQARKDSPLTYFEFGTLAAIDVFFKQQPDLVILEVGLGGRLDAVNIMDADVCVLTSVAIDHIDWLGDDRESIGYEKAGIFRSNKPVICGESDVPMSVIEHAKKLNCKFIQIARDYNLSINKNATSWDLHSGYRQLLALAAPGLLGEFQYNNAATAIVALQALQLNISKQAVSAGLKQTKLSGRFQLINKKPQAYVDVAHNPQAAKALAAQLKDSNLALEESGSDSSSTAKTWAILAMLSDKDVQGVLTEVSTEIDYWCFASLQSTARGLSAQALLDRLPEDFINEGFIEQTKEKNQCKMRGNSVLLVDTVALACETVLSKVGENDRIIIFGSFYTVAEAMNYFSVTGPISVSGSNTNILESIN